MLHFDVFFIRMLFLFMAIEEGFVYLLCISKEEHNMYYASGTYEAFAHPKKPKDVDEKSAYIIGTGLAGLSAAFYLVRDGQMKGEHIHLLEKLDLAGGSCDGRKDLNKGFYQPSG